ncbi:MAG: hypothetical protein AAF465_14055, partial [Pseudomonadota bacterium]
MTKLLRSVPVMVALVSLSVLAQAPSKDDAPPPLSDIEADERARAVATPSEELSQDGTDGEGEPDID